MRSNWKTCLLSALVAVATGCDFSLDPPPDLDREASTAWNSETDALNGDGQWNACGGQALLAGAPGEPCGPCAVLTCTVDGEAVQCMLDTTLPGCGTRASRQSGLPTNAETEAPATLPDGLASGSESHGDTGTPPTSETPGPQPSPPASGESSARPNPSTPPGGTTSSEPGATALAPPPLDTPFGQLADLTGRFFMRMAVSGSSLVLDYIVDVVMEDLPSGEPPTECTPILRGSNRVVRGELLIFTDDDRYGPDDPPAHVFCSQVSDRGRFNVLIPELVSPSGLGQVSADVALALTTVDQNTFCGDAAGAMTSPLTLNLAGSSVGFVRIPGDFWGLPDEPRRACPATLADPPDPLPIHGQRTNIDGRWFLRVQSLVGTGGPVLTFNYIGDLRYFSGDERDDSPTVDAIIRRYGGNARPTDPAVGLVSGSAVDDRGQFTLLIDGELATDPIQGTSHEGNIALRAVIVDDTLLCGEGRGRIFRPFQAPFVEWKLTAARLPGDLWAEFETLPPCP